MSFFKYLENHIVINNIEAEEVRKRTFLAMAVLIVLPIISLFVLEDFIQDRFFEGMSGSCVMLALLLLIYALRNFEKIYWVYRFTASVILFFLAYGIAIGGADEHSFLWYYSFPLCVFYVFEKKEGVIWVCLSTLLAGFFFFNPSIYEYKPSTGIRFVIVYIIISLLSFGLESSRREYFLDLKKEKDKTEKTNQLLEEKVQLLDQSNQDLKKALDTVKVLSGLLPICASCKKIRDDKGYWNQLETYISSHSDTEFTHSLCPDCLETMYGDEDWFKKLNN